MRPAYASLRSFARTFVGGQTEDSKPRVNFGSSMAGRERNSPFRDKVSLEAGAHASPDLGEHPLAYLQPSTGFSVLTSGIVLTYKLIDFMTDTSSGEEKEVFSVLHHTRLSVQAGYTTTHEPLSSLF